MRVFKCLSNNVSMVMDQEKKKRKAASGGRLRLNFKTKKRRPLSALSPNAGKNCSDAIPVLSPTPSKALKNLRLGEPEATPPSTPRTKAAGAQPRPKPQAVKVKRRALPLPSIPFHNGVSIYVKDLDSDEMDADYVPLTHVEPDVSIDDRVPGNADSAASLDTLTSSTGLDALETGDSRRKAGLDTLRTGVSHCKAGLDAVGEEKMKSVKSLNEAFIQSTASLLARRLLPAPPPTAAAAATHCPDRPRGVTYSRQRQLGSRDWKRRSRHRSDGSPATGVNPTGIAEMCQGGPFRPVLTVHDVVLAQQLDSTVSSQDTADDRSSLLLLDSQAGASSCDDSAAWTTQSLSQDSPSLCRGLYENLRASRRSECDGRSQTSFDRSPGPDSPYHLYARPRGKRRPTASAYKFEESTRHGDVYNNITNTNDFTNADDDTYASEIDDASIDYDHSENAEDPEDKENRMECVPSGDSLTTSLLPRSAYHEYANVTVDADRDEGVALRAGHSPPDASSNCRTSEFLGCMSFGVPHLLKKNVDGWYYLLTEDVGRQKHLKAHTKVKALIPHQGKGVPSLGPINPATDGQDRLIVTVAKGKHGFGFSFVGEMPPKVGRVDYGSPAEEAGVRRGDSVIRINGQNVSRSTCEGVAHLIKKRNPRFLALELVRHRSSPGADSVASDPSDSYSRRQMGTSTDHVYESISDSPNASAEYHKENCGWRDDVNGMMDEDREVTDDEQIILSMGGEGHSTTTSTPFPSKLSSAARSSCAQRKKQESVHRLMSLELDYIDFMRFGTERYSRPLRHCIITATQHSVLFQNVEKLLTISEYHIKQLEDSSASGSIYLNDSLPGTSSSSHSSPAFIYQPKIHMLCQAYETYGQGLKHSNAMLKALRKNQDFKSFIQVPSAGADSFNSFQQPSICQFINRPIQHIHELYAVLRDILSATPTHSPDYAVLKQVVAKLGECITAIINLSSDGLVHSVDSLASSQAFSTSQATSTKGSLASLVSCSSSEFDAAPKSLAGSRASLLSDLATLQTMLVFPPDVPTFQLCHEERQIIYKGDIFRCHQGLWFKSQVLLLSDLMLVLDLEPDGRLKVVQTPVYLSDLAGLEVNRKHASEFILHLHTTPTYSTLSQASCAAISTKLVFRAPSVQEKLMWTSLLEKHAAAVLGKKLKHYGSMQDISNIKTSLVL